MKKLNTLAALSGAALSIPVPAEVTPTDEVISYRYSSYQEAESPRERTATLETQRYQIDVHQLAYRLPLNDDWYLNADLQYETLSGASPTQTYKNDEGRSVLLMSGASIEEQRTDLRLSPKRYFKHGTAGGTFAYSTENDYESLALGVDGTLDIFDKHTTLIGSLSKSVDTLSPTEPELGAARQAADGRGKQSVSVYEGISQVINKYSVLQAGIGYTRLSGYLSDPYKFQDRRPDNRDQYTFSANYRHFADVLDGAALHADARLYRDDWGVNSQTLEVKWNQGINFWNLRGIFSPKVRYYRQNEADFYSLVQDSAESGSVPEFKSSDYRLSSYGALSFGIENTISWQQWAFHLDYNYYMSREDLAILGGTDDETPALVNFTTFTLGVDYKL